MDEEQDGKEHSDQLRPNAGGHTQDMALQPGQQYHEFANVPNIQLQGQTVSYTRLLEGVIAMGSQEDKYVEEELEAYAGLLDGFMSLDEGWARLQPKHVGFSVQRDFEDEGNSSYHAQIRAEDEVHRFHDFEDRAELYADDPWKNNLFHNMSILEENEKEIITDTSPTASHSEVCTENPTEQDFQNAREEGQPEQSRDSNAIDEEDIENFLENERLAEEEEDLRTNNINTTPLKGMQFDSREKVQEFFTFYAYLARFSPAITKVSRTASKKRNGEVISVTMKCNKHGKNNEAEPQGVVPKRKTTVTDKIDCPVEMVAKEKHGVWIIKSLNLEHNHPPGPLCETKYFKAHKFMSKEEKELIRILKRTNTPTRKIVETLAYIRGGMAQLPYGTKDVANYGTKITREVGRNDMMEVAHFFNKKIVEDPGFFYSFELDEENKVRSIFWSDAKSRLQYQEEGECVSFDVLVDKLCEAYP